MNKIVIVVKGGVVQQVLSEEKQTVVLIDWDNIEQGDNILYYFTDLLTEDKYQTLINEVDTIKQKQ